MTLHKNLHPNRNTECKILNKISIICQGLAFAVKTFATLVSESQWVDSSHSGNVMRFPSVRSCRGASLCSPTLSLPSVLFNVTYRQRDLN